MNRTHHKGLINQAPTPALAESRRTIFPNRFPADALVHVVSKLWFDITLPQIQRFHEMIVGVDYAAAETPS